MDCRSSTLPAISGGLTLTLEPRSILDSAALECCCTVLGMKVKDLNRKQLFSIPCPTCHVAAGKPCVLSFGGLRTEPHVDRKLLAAEAAGGKKKKKNSLVTYAEGLFQQFD
jgi:hypothetical protein